MQPTKLEAPDRREDVGAMGEFIRDSAKRRMLLAIVGDRRVSSAALARAVSVVLGPMVALGTIQYLSLEGQGLYYTMVSMIGMAGYAELGGGQVLMQLGARVSAKMDGEDLRRAAGLLRLTLRWSAIAAVTISSLIVPIGVAVFLGRGGHWRQWGWQWLAVGGIAPLGIGLALMNSLFEGFQHVAATYARRTVQAITYGLALVICLASKCGLWSLALAHAASISVGIGGIVLTHRRQLREMLRETALKVDWRHEVWPLQWRYAASWVTGIAVFSIFNPLLLTMHGAADAGRFGLTFSVVSAALGFGQVWFSGRAAHFAALNAKGELAELKRSFLGTAKRSAATAFVALAAVAAVHTVVVSMSPSTAKRILELGPTMFLAVGQLAVLAVSGMTTFVRSFCQEPFVRVAWLNAGIALLLTPIGVRFGRSTGAAAAYCATQVLVVPAAYAVFRRYFASEGGQQVGREEDSALSG